MSKAKTPPLPPTQITGCHFEVINSTNEFTRDAVVALARAAEANAKAIEAAALALAGSASETCAIKIGQ